MVAVLALKVSKALAVRCVKLAAGDGARINGTIDTILADDDLHGTEASAGVAVAIDEITPRTEGSGAVLARFARYGGGSRARQEES